MALTQLRDAGLLPPDDAQTLLRADHVWRTIQGILRLTVGQPTTQTLPSTPAALLLEAVARAGVQAVDIVELLLRLDVVAFQVRAHFRQTCGRTKRMSVSEGDPAPDFSLPAIGRPDGQPGADEG